MFKRSASPNRVVAVYIPPQTNAVTKTALNELYTAISKQENAHTEAELLVPGDFNAGKRKAVLPHFYQQMLKQMINYRTVLLSQTGTCSGILPMTLRSRPHQSLALSISASRMSSPQ